MPGGKFEKIKIYAYNGKAERVGTPFTAMINPESYVLDYKVEFQAPQGNGTSAAQQIFTMKKPEEMQFEFLFDATGIIDDNPRDNVFDDIDKFKRLLLDFDSDSHEPYYFKLVWGKFVFTGRCNTLTITYKLFNSDGSPIRAVCKVGFKASIDEKLRVAIENVHSPDLTHKRIVKHGDTLPLLCYQVYGDAKYYIQIAAVNKLQNFRSIHAGDVLYFPPIVKTTSK
jgi:hypothetical protein